MVKHFGGKLARYATATAALLVVGILVAYAAETNEGYEVHDMKRPQPPVVTPGTFSTQEQPGTPPSDAVVLFDGKDTSKWKADKGGGEVKWKVADGYLEVVKGAGQISTKDNFGDCQLHVEWMAPNPPKGTSQARGNSGIFLMSRYEIQVLDCYKNETYADGTTGCLYGQYPPIVNACRPPGEWQMYDIIFRRPRYEGGKVVQPARATVILNGVVVQDSMELIGTTSHKALAKYPPTHPDSAPIALQDHGDPVRFRNIWVRPLPEKKEVPPVRAATDHK